ncbi:MAG: rRNA pseudouridine synthase [Planctomycetes bacterium]|nr:rRNA pseudouridine synthase [Planctomycetota bacterium]
MPIGGKALDRLLERAGLCSRAAARAAVAAGRVTLNDRVVRDPDEWADIAHDRVHFDGQAVLPRPREVWAMHKPVGHVTTTDDEHGRATVCDLLPADRPWLVPIGRLDLASSGLLLFTNDSHFAAALMDPTSKLPKVYEARCKGHLPEAALDRLRTGVLLHRHRTLPATVEPLDHDARTTRLRITLVEGRNRQIRRMLKAVGSRVNTLHRVRIGPLSLGDLPVGACRQLDDAEVASLRAAVAERTGPDPITRTDACS